ncbi:hypothetical protein Hanom_Chr05g00400381 [Helianthus anomalus]
MIKSCFGWLTCSTCLLSLSSCNKLYRVNFKFCLLFIIVNFRWCTLFFKLMSLVLNILKTCTLCPLALTLLDFSVKSGHVACT